MTARESLAPLKTLIFAEVAYWAVAGLLSTPSREAVPDDTPLRRACDRISRRFVAILKENGVGYAEFLDSFFSRIPAAASLAGRIREGHFVNFVLRCAWLAEEGVRVPSPVNSDGTEGERLLALLAGQDFSVEQRLEARLAAPGGVFLQVGANDLATVDDRPFRPIYESADWRKVLVEPTMIAFQALQKATADLPATKLVRAAVDGKSGTRRISSSSQIAESRQSTFSNDLAFSRGVLDRTETVRCLDGPALAKAAGGIDAIDVLVVDTEGHDRVVVDEVLRIAEPSVIIVEWAHAGLADAIRLIETFETRGYDWCWPPISLDFVAIKRGSDA